MHRYARFEIFSLALAPPTAWSSGLRRMKRLELRPLSTQSCTQKGRLVKFQHSTRARSNKTKLMCLAAAEEQLSFLPDGFSQTFFQTRRNFCSS